MNRGYSLGAERVRGVGAAGLKRGDPGGGDPGERQEEGDGKESDRIDRRNVIEQRGEASRRQERDRDADDEADEDEPQSVPNDKPTHAADGRAEGDANAH